MRKAFWVFAVAIAMLFAMAIISRKDPKYFLPSKAKKSLTITPTNNPRYLESWEIHNRMMKYGETRPDMCKYDILKPFTGMNHQIGALTIDPFSQKGKKIQVFIVAALNPMSWSAPLTLLKMCDMLLTDYRLGDFGSSFSWYIIPVVNPEGMDFTQTVRWLPPVEVAFWRPLATSKRPKYWHKNLNGVDRVNNSCFGTNVDRNFPFHFHDESPSDSCSQYFGGSSPLSAPESIAVDEYIREKRVPTSKSIFVQVESTLSPSKESVVYPWDFTDVSPMNKNVLRTIAKNSVKKANSNFKVMQGHHYTKSSGTLIDYAMGIMGIDYVFRIQPYQMPIPVSFGYDHDKVDLVANLILCLVREWYDHIQTSDPPDIKK